MKQKSKLPMVEVVVGGILGKPRSLDTLKDCKRETARVYRSAATGRITWADATKAIYSLTALANFIIAADLELQLHEAERTISHHGQNTARY